MSLEEDFKLASAYIRSLPKDGDVKPSQEQQLAAYKFFKQATQGDVQGTQPWAVQLEARAKWDAWNSVKGMSKDDAMTKYVELIASMKADWRDDAKARGVTA
eukprot:TRINITY_DN24740_c0_g1_i1.p1 TRINITY_DN24740_c0_g1~~TRINITY_DN24740_c0_g1_i1.p1  ORF type:complete len:118 (+),score=19.54 TRINITY_DN24740_c0_g1_i1:49-354(+)